jgi:Protein of unknown function (DUF1553)/Protein of unknown function (DUF1549)/Planctomycete cytochrome C
VNRWLCVAGTLLAGALVVRAESQSASPQADSIDFVRDIQPILSRHCYECHGSSKGRGGLRLHVPHLILKGGASGPVVTPGKSDESLLIHRVLGLGFDDQMPLDGDPLPPEAVARLRAWIDRGAVVPPTDPTLSSVPATQEHWAYAPPRRREPPPSAAGWARNPVDRFILARLEREKLEPSPEADRTTLLRRVTLDLIGLPPTPAEVSAFLADTSVDAYDKVVDRLLASPHYGERWARPWLDLARYADTNGYEKDNRRAIWKYRDWLISALNRDLPFDQFTIEQIAGDMLPNATVDQKIATGFHRNAMTNEEGGVDPDESMYEVLVDRVNTTATTWLGTTLACAQCHNHKYDPFTQKDYFRFLAFFANSDYESRTFGDGTRYFEPRLDLATPEQEKARTALQAEIDRLDATLKKDTLSLRTAQARWERTTLAAERAWTPLEPDEVSATNGVLLRTLPDRSVLASGPNPSLTSYTITATTLLQGITGIRLEALPDESLPRGGPGRDAYGHFRVTGVDVQIAPSTGATPRRVDLSAIEVDDSAYAFKPEDLLSADAQRSRRSGSWSINAMRDTERSPRHAFLAARAPFGFPKGTRITVRVDHLDGTIGQGIGRFRLSVTSSADPLAGSDVPARLRPVIARAAADRTKAQADDLKGFFRSKTPLLAPTRDALAGARKKLADLQIPSTLVMKERPSFERPSYELRERGSFTAKGPRVYAGIPSALHPMREDQPANRLGLARWLVDDRNPLTARVAVNRFWEQIFGRGLVETSEDFGAQGSAPSHPELLDWLATELIAKRWSQKALIRTLVTSSTYRQSSTAAQALLDRDPYNRLLARGPRFRLDAESVRDLTLAVSGLLSPKMYGPSVFPLQPAGIWNMPYNSDKWTTSEGDDRYRRSLYTFWRRTSPYPSFMTFDATSREFCTVRRVRTNTPLQALTLLNDPVSFEAARALAARMTSDEAGSTSQTRASFGFRLVLSRDPKPAERDRLVALFERELGRSGTELAAWTLVANVLLNLDETVTKE